SGIGDRDFLEAVWYRRRVTVPADWDGLRPILHFGAVDHDATVWADGIEAARHRGGFTPFRADLAAAGVGAGDEVELAARAGGAPDAAQARGKQPAWVRPPHAVCPRATGIWQTVWPEGGPTDALRSLRILPALASRSFGIDVPLSRSTPGTRL